MNLVKAALSVGLVLASDGWSQSRPTGAKSSILATAPVVELGATKDRVHEQFGPPSKWYVPKSGKHLFSQAEYSAALSVYGNVADVYYRKTGANEFEIRIFYSLDQSKSRLHPEIRVSRADFILDRPMAPLDLLAELEEARSLCRPQCQLIGTSQIPRKEIVAYLEQQTPTQSLLAKDVASGWVRDRDSPFRWNLAVHLEWNNEASYMDRPDPEFEWLLQNIESVRFGVENTNFDYEYKNNKILRIPLPKVLGTWEWTRTPRFSKD